MSPRPPDRFVRARPRQPRSGRRPAGAGVAAPLVLLLLAAFGLRTWQLGRQSFWWDEAYSAVVARGDIPSIIREVASVDFHPPLHYILLHLWRIPAGEGEYALRFISVWFGTATVALAYAFGQRLFGAGRLTAALTAFSPFLWYYSTEARMFAPAAFLTLLALYLSRRGKWLGSGIVAAVALYTYYYALLALVPLVRRPRAAIVAGILFLPWLPVLIGRTGEWASPWTSPTSPLAVLRWTWPTLLTGLAAADLWNDRLIALAMWLVLVVGIGLLAFGTWRRATREPTLYALAAAAVPLALIAGVALFRDIYHPRYAAAAAPALLLALAGGIAVAFRNPPKPQGGSPREGTALGAMAAGLTLLAAVATLEVYGLVRYADGDGLQRDDYRSAVASMTPQPGDAAITNAPPGLNYYYRGPSRELPVGEYTPANVVAQLADATTGANRLWYLTHALRPSDPEHFVEAQLALHARERERKELGQLRLRLFELTSPFADIPRRAAGRFAFGDSLELVSVAAGSGSGTVPVQLEWLVKSVPPADVGIWVQLTDEDGFRWGREDHQPRDGRFLLSSRWQPGSRVTTGQIVTLPPGTPPGTYRLVVGAYRLSDVSSLEVRSASGQALGQSVVVGTVTVDRQPGSSAANPGGAGGRLDSTIELTGSGVSVAEAAAGSTVELSLWWRTVAPTPPRQASVRLVDTSGLARQIHELPAGGRYTSDRWQPGELVRQQLRIVLVPTLPDGAYQVRAGIAGGSEIAIGELRVHGVARTSQAPPMDRALALDFGDGVRLAGYRLQRQPNKTTLTLVWQPGATPSREYKVFVHVLDVAGAIGGQHDAAPANWARPTTGWVAGEYVEDAHEIAGPESGVVRFGVYDPATGQRLTTNGRDHLDIAP